MVPGSEVGSVWSRGCRAARRRSHAKLITAKCKANRQDKTATRPCDVHVHGAMGPWPWRQEGFERPPGGGFLPGKGVRRAVPGRQARAGAQKQVWWGSARGGEGERARPLTGTTSGFKKSHQRRTAQSVVRSVVMHGRS